MSKILDGKALSEQILDNLKGKLQNIMTEKYIAIIVVGDNFGSQVYSKMKQKRAGEIGLKCKIFSYEETVSENQVVSKIKYLSESDECCGIMIQHPMPKHIDEKRCFNLIPAEKDIDGLSSVSFGLLGESIQKYVPATALGIVKLIDHYNINLVGEKVLVIGKSQIVGLPLSIMLLQKGATVTVAHSRTKNLPDEIKNNKIIIVAIGKAEFIKAEWINSEHILIDAGYNAGNVGDIEHKAYEISSMYTPVPGGVGPMTIASLLEQSVDSIFK